MFAKGRCAMVNLLLSTLAGVLANFATHSAGHIATATPKEDSVRAPRGRINWGAILPEAQTDCYRWRHLCPVCHVTFNNAFGLSEVYSSLLEVLHFKYYNLHRSIDIVQLYFEASQPCLVKTCPAHLTIFFFFYYHTT
eukprot:4857132-Pyramimonas_sp.AAC.2